ncbi:MAG: carotenoid biosynthesis protein [Armatimonadetes bacterium]|nr:carotenoid biosynthesis protein [Armatimonadota bacterium]
MNETDRGARPGLLRAVGAALFGLSTAIVVFSLAGTWALANLDVPDANYERLSQALGIANIVLASGACMAWLWAVGGGRTAVEVLLLCAAISGSVEAVGVATGIPFGEYSYTDQLGPKLGGVLPAVIPLAWFMMMYPALQMAQQTRLRVPGKAALAGLAMVTWDLALDPAMTAGARAWEWQEGGVYYGIPFQNFLGWFLTAFLLALACLAVLGKKPADRSAMPLALYLVQSLFPALLAVLYGRPWTAVVWLAGLAVLWGLVRWYASPAETPRRENGSA